MTQIFSNTIPQFTEAMITGLEWQQVVPLQTRNNHYRIEITWALDRYRISVRNLLTGVLVHRKAAFYRHTAVATANKFIQQYERGWQ